MYSSKETLSGRARPEQIMQTSLRGISSKARREKGYCFRDIYRLINKNALRETWQMINAKEFAMNLDVNIENLLDDLKNKRYYAKLVSRVYIEKDNGKKRPLGIPTVRDKLLQTTVARILEAIYEQVFIENSYGYRPNRSVHTAIQALSKELQHNKYGWVVEADIRGFFDNIDHKWMVKMLEHRIDDKI